VILCFSRANLLYSTVNSRRSAERGVKLVKPDRNSEDTYRCKLSLGVGSYRICICNTENCRIEVFRRLGCSGHDNFPASPAPDFEVQVLQRPEVLTCSRMERDVSGSRRGKLLGCIDCYRDMSWRLWGPWSAHGGIDAIEMPKCEFERVSSNLKVRDMKVRNAA
jgi:hypothetical protein